MRAKGFFWLASRPQWAGELSHAGALVRHHRAGWAAVPKDRWPQDEEVVTRIRKNWHETWGDRKQELVFIGTKDMDQKAITAELNACLMPSPRDGRVAIKAWAKLPDPFPDWQPDAH